MSQEKVADTIQSDPIISSTNVNGSPSRRAKKTRVRTGCLQCKRRHVRCDEEGRPHPQSVEEAGQCLACRRLGLECIWPSLNHTIDVHARTTKRSRAESDSDLPQPSIESTEKDNPQSQNSINKITNQLANFEVKRTLVEIYFIEVYPCSVFAFLNKKTFLKAFRDGKAPEGLTLAVCSISGRYVSEDHREQSSRWAAEAKSITFGEIERGRVTAATLGSLILCFHLELFDRVFGAAWITSGMAIRLAYALRFNLIPNVPPPGTQQISWSEAESRRRLMWAVYVMDMYVCDGFPEYSNVSWSSMRIQLPCDEESFESEQGYESGTFSLPETKGNSPWVQPNIHPRSAKSTLAQYILIFSIRTTILSYIRKRVMDDDLPWQENSTAKKCEQALQWWKDNLPPELDFVDQRQQLPTSTADLSSWLALHLWHSSCYCDLGRLTIYTFVESAPPDLLLSAPQNYVDSAQNQCVEHATKILDICKYILDKRPDFVPRDPYLSACLYQATRIVLWDLFRHPSPSSVMKKFVAELCMPATVLLYRMASLFSYPGCVMEDTFRLFRRYGLLDVMSARLPSEVATALRQQHRQFKPGPAIFLDASEQSALKPSPEPPPPDQLPFMPDQGQSELFRPPFHWRKDVRLAMTPTESSVSPSNPMSTSPMQTWNSEAAESWTRPSYQTNNSEDHVRGSITSSQMQYQPHEGTISMGSEASATSVQFYDSNHLRENSAQNPSQTSAAVTGITPGIFGYDQSDYQESHLWGDMNWPSTSHPFLAPWSARTFDGNNSF